MKKRIKWHDLVSAESEDGTFDFVQDLNGKDIRLYMFTPMMIKTK